ncbi:MAG: hypothetical protein UR78_C0001G0072 [Candidatus Moranbacteria bacterium GW2011_GWF2_35_39]|nr:MAG: hypothetical protein UR78_C0001G0072 [Candidatus Moranbacteria bacterium GW2011_GWF2_35_39]
MKKRKKKYKSVITQRIFQSVKKLAMVFCGLFLILGMGKIQGTSSYFADSAVSAGNAFSSGYWIVPTVEVISPESGDEWQVGSTQDITWTADSSDPTKTAGMSIDINYQCGGGSWSNIANGTTNDGSYSWIVPTNISDECEIRIFATDDYALTGMDDSDQFEISYMIVLNEFVPYPASGLTEMVEIYNYGDEAVDVNNWFITDNQGPASHRRLIDSAHTDTGSTTINPSSSRFLVITNYADFYLNNTGSDDVRLYDSAGNLIDEHSFSDAVQGKSYARIPDGVGNWVDPVPTPGEKNNPSNDLDDMRKYYKKACFDDGKPICKESFLKSLGLLEEDKKEEKAEEIIEEIIVEENPVIPIEESTVEEEDSVADEEEAEIETDENNTDETEDNNVLEEELNEEIAEEVLPSEEELIEEENNNTDETVEAEGETEKNISEEEDEEKTETEEVKKEPTLSVDEEEKENEDKKIEEEKLEAEKKAKAKAEEEEKEKIKAQEEKAKVEAKAKEEDEKKKEKEKKDNEEKEDDKKEEAKKEEEAE